MLVEVFKSLITGVGPTAASPAAVCDLLRKHETEFSKKKNLREIQVLSEAYEEEKRIVVQIFFE